MDHNLSSCTTQKSKNNDYEKKKLEMLRKPTHPQARKADSPWVGMRLRRESLAHYVHRNCCSKWMTHVAIIFVAGLSFCKKCIGTKSPAAVVKMFNIDS